MSIKNKLNDDIIKEILVYIDENFTKQELNVSYVAYHFNIALNELSHGFKARIGTGMLDYIHKKRIDFSKKLLLDDVILEKIALKVGYVDADLYIKKFKKYEGITPGKYRSLKKINI